MHFIKKTHFNIKYKIAKKRKMTKPRYPADKTLGNHQRIEIATSMEGSIREEKIINGSGMTRKKPTILLIIYLTVYFNTSFQMEYKTKEIKQIIFKELI